MKGFCTAATVAAIVYAFVPRTAGAQEYAKSYSESERHYLELKQKAGGGTRMTWDKLPDWTGLWTREGGTRFDPKVPNYAATTAKLTPEYRSRFEKKLADQKNGIEWDHLKGYPLSDGRPAALLISVAKADGSVLSSNASLRRGPGGKPLEAPVTQ